MVTRKLSFWRFSLMSLLALPACFALGWYCREWKFEHDVQTTAEQIVTEVGGHIVPELGIIVGGQEMADRQKEVDNQSKSQLSRRAKFFAKMRKKGVIEVSVDH